MKLLKSFNEIEVNKKHISFGIGYGLFYFIGCSLNNGYNSFYLAFILMSFVSIIFLFYFTHIKYI